MLFAIRDDDIDYWTDINHLEMIYAPLWRKGIVVSFSVIPFGVKTYYRGDGNAFYQMEEIERPVGANEKIISYLREKISQGKIEIMLHGYNHLYKVRELCHSSLYVANKENLQALRAKKRGSGLQWVPGCLWKTEEQLTQELKKGKDYLESLFSKPVKVFVPPSNSIGPHGSRVLDVLRMNLSGTIGRRRDRDWSYDYIRAYMKRLVFFLGYGGAPYPFPLRIKNHSELVAYPLTPSISLKTLKKQADRCRKMNAPFVLATHHWELYQRPNLRVLLRSLIDYVLKFGGRPVPLSTLFQ